MTTARQLITRRLIGSILPASPHWTFAAYQPTFPK
jgi:hypothetical protein